MTSAFRSPIPCRWNGIDYPSYNAAARANGVTQSVMRARLLAGYTCDDDMGYPGYECEWNGRKFRSIRAAARFVGISREGMMYRVRMGYTCDGDMKR